MVSDGLTREPSSGTFKEGVVGLMSHPVYAPRMQRQNHVVIDKLERLLASGVLRKTVLWVGALLGTAALVGVGLQMPTQVVLLVLGIAAAFVLHDRSRVLTFVVVLVPTLSLVRRIVAGPQGYAESDPLILLPVVLTLVIVMMSWTRPRTNDRGHFMRGLAAAVIIGVGVTVLLRAAFTVQGLFNSSLIIVPLLLAIAISAGRLPSMWSAVRAVLVPVSLLAGTYGIVQFVFLPSWDRAWMITSELTTIGAPLPFKVRVFGASESPGPYALFLGLVITMSLASAVTARNRSRAFLWLGLATYLTVPLLLSGVRSALLGVVVCAVTLTLIRARGLTRVLLIAFLAASYYLLTLVLTRFGAGSSILTTDRYMSFSTQDTSFVARLNLLRSVGNPLSYMVGNPNSANADNLFVNTLIRFGFVAALALLLLVATLTVRAFKNLLNRRDEAVSLPVVFLTVMALFGPTFDAMFGLLVGVMYGCVMSQTTERRVHGISDSGQLEASLSVSDGNAQRSRRRTAGTPA
jgi:hypothetical protein